MTDEVDSTRIRSIAVHREDVANALEATLRSDRTVVLRVTPPYSGRMRARIHRVEATSGSEPDDGVAEADAPIHLNPRDLVTEMPAYPEVDDTVAEAADLDPETRRERHVEAVEAWRERVRESVGGTVAIHRREAGNTTSADDGEGVDADDSETPVSDRSETHEVDIVALG